jgi:hypothetical protein
MTKYLKILLPSTHYVGHASSEARLAFNPIASTQYHVIEYVDDDALYLGVEIYSSQTEAWIYKESKWEEDTDVTYYKQLSVFFIGCMHIIGHNGEYDMILAVDMEENTWRQLDKPDGLLYSMHQAQGHLCVCVVNGSNESKL